MLPSWCRDSVTVWRAPLVSQRGTKVRDWSAATSHVVEGCSLQPSSTTTEWGSVRQADESGAVLYLPPNADIEAEDRVEHAGRTWAVDGVPYDWASPTGRVTHRQARLREWVG